MVITGCLASGLGLGIASWKTGEGIATAVGGAILTRVILAVAVAGVAAAMVRRRRATVRRRVLRSSHPVPR